MNKDQQLIWEAYISGDESEVAKLTQLLIKAGFIPKRKPPLPPVPGYDPSTSDFDEEAFDKAWDEQFPGRIKDFEWILFRNKNLEHIEIDIVTTGEQLYNVEGFNSLTNEGIYWFSEAFIEAARKRHGPAHKFSIDQFSVDKVMDWLKDQIMP